MITLNDICDHIWMSFEGGPEVCILCGVYREKMGGEDEVQA